MALPSALPEVLISYSQEDESWKNRLVQQLQVLEQERILTIHEDPRMPKSGHDDWGRHIEMAMDRARVAVLLISADFLTSGFMHGRDVPELLQRREMAGLRVIPVIVSPCLWRNSPRLAQIQCWPTNAKPLSSLSDAEVENELSSLALAIRRFLLTARPPAVVENATVVVTPSRPVVAPRPLSPPVPPPVPAPALPQAPPPISQPLPAPRQSHGGILLGIGCATVLGVLALVSLVRWLPKPTGEPPATDAPPTATTLTGETPATDAPPSAATTTAAEVLPTAAPPSDTTATEVSSTDAPPSSMPTTAGETEPAAAGLGGQFLDVWVEQNVHRWARRGVLIHSRFIVHGARRDRCQLIAYFQDASRESLEGFAAGSRTDEGQITVTNGFTPKDDPAQFEDLTLFIPYDKLKLAPGINRLKFLLQVQRRSSGEILATSSEISLTLQR